MWCMELPVQSCSTPDSTTMSVYLSTGQSFSCTLFLNLVQSSAHNRCTYHIACMLLLILKLKCEFYNGPEKKTMNNIAHAVDTFELLTCIQFVILIAIFSYLHWGGFYHDSSVFLNLAMSICWCMLVACKCLLASRPTNWKIWKYEFETQRLRMYNHIYSQYPSLVSAVLSWAHLSAVMMLFSY